MWEEKGSKLKAIWNIFEYLNNYFFLKIESFQGKKQKHSNYEREPQKKFHSPLHQWKIAWENKSPLCISMQKSYIKFSKIFFLYKKLELFLQIFILHTSHPIGSIYIISRVPKGFPNSIKKLKYYIFSSYD